MNKKVLILIGIIILIIIIAGMFYVTNSLLQESNENISNRNEITTNSIETEVISNENPPEETEGLTIVPTMQDTITSDSSWCGTFQLVWNDMKNEVVKKDVVFTPQEEMAANLNKEEFKEGMLSDEYYFKKYGLKTIELKEEIEKGIKEKFNQASDILEDFDWSEEGLNDPNNSSVDRYFFYVMLYRKFEYLKEFDKLEKGEFGDKYDSIEYFGIDQNTNESVGDQIEVLYYNSKDDFSIAINTKTNDEVIFCKNPKGNTFNEIYDNINNESNKYTGSKYFEDIDKFKAPNLTFNEKREYTELQNKPFSTATGRGEIEKAIQTIQFSLDEKGGEIKSEAAIDVEFATAVLEPVKKEPRYFYVDDTFAVFLREKGQSLPYFAGRIEDITKFQ